MRLKPIGRSRTTSPMVFVRSLLVLSLCAAYLSGCAASSGYTTRSYPTVPKPAQNSEYSSWLDYYTDQFASLGDKVEPPSANASTNAKSAYSDAKANWDKHVSASKHQMDQSKKAANTMWYAIGGVAAALLILNFAAF